MRSQFFRQWRYWAFLFAVAITPGTFAATGQAAEQPSFANLKDGDSVKSPVIVKVHSGDASANMAMKMSDGMMGSHVHLIVDSPLPKVGETIPMDDKHIHLMNGEKAIKLKLAPGNHTLQLVVGGADHQVQTPVLASDKITIHVKGKSG